MRLTLGVARQTVLIIHILSGEPVREVGVVRGWGRGGVPQIPLQPRPPQQLVPLPYSALLHTLLAPEEMTAVDTLGGPWPPAVPMGTQ